SAHSASSRPSDHTPFARVLAAVASTATAATTLEPIVSATSTVVMWPRLRPPLARKATQHSTAAIASAGSHATHRLAATRPGPARRGAAGATPVSGAGVISAAGAAARGSAGAAGADTV